MTHLDCIKNHFSLSSVVLDLGIVELSGLLLEYPQRPIDGQAQKRILFFDGDITNSFYEIWNNSPFLSTETKMGEVFSEDLLDYDYEVYQIFINKRTDFSIKESYEIIKKLFDSDTLNDYDTEYIRELFDSCVSI